MRGSQVRARTEFCENSCRGVMTLAAIQVPELSV